MISQKRKSGVLLHPTSLPGGAGIGTLGKEAYDFIDFLILSDQKLWQTFPLGPTGFGDSPYQCFSAFASNPILLDLEQLVAQSLLTADELGGAPPNDGKVNYGQVILWKTPILQKAASKFFEIATPIQKAKFNRFCEENAYWLDDFALFMSLKELFLGNSWLSWPEDIKMRKPKAMASYQEKLSGQINNHRFLQYEFFRQWGRLKEYANLNGVQIIGDIPLYIALDSSDTWSHPKLFEFDENCNPKRVAGVPPDYFSVTGQLWGNPIYNWAYHQETKFDWWLKRIQANLKMADYLRFDHFRGLCAFWAVPYGDATAVNGEWVKAPGKEFFAAIQESLGDIPLIAEDLGLITKDVVDLREEFQLPSMKILQFAFDSLEDSSKSFIPHVYERNTVVYTGTHDNDSVVGWFSKANKNDREYAKSYLLPETSIARSFIRTAWSSTSIFALAPMQDLLELGSDARMNTPGVVIGNWQWRFNEKDINEDLVQWLASITKLYGR